MDIEENDEYPFLDVFSYEVAPEGIEDVNRAYDVALRRLEFLQKLDKRFQEIEKSGSDNSKFYSMYLSWGEKLYNEYCRPAAKYEDQVGHWLLKLAYHRSPAWFVRLEGLMFDCKLNFVIHKLGKKKGLHLIISSLERFYKDTCNYNFRKVDDMYVVPFEDVGRLLSQYAIIIKAGIAYVPEEYLNQLLGALFQRNLWAESRWVENNIQSFLNEDEKLSIVLDRLYNSQDVTYSGTLKFGKEMSYAEIQNMGKLQFPLCMSQVAKL